MLKNYFFYQKPSSAVVQLAIPANAVYQRIVNMIGATNDKAATVLSMWLASTTVIRASTGTTASGQKTILCNLTAGIVASDVCLIQDVVDPTIYEIFIPDVVTDNISYHATSNLTKSYSAAAKIYVFKSGGGLSGANWALDCGIATIQREAATLYHCAAIGQPMLYEFDSCTSLCNITVAGFLTDNA